MTSTKNVDRFSSCGKIVLPPSDETPLGELTALPQTPPPPPEKWEAKGKGEEGKGNGGERR